MIDPKELAIELLKAPTERDLQVKVGASNLAQPCARCLADALIASAASTNHQSPYWLGAVLGTATHNYLEGRIRSMHPEMEPEQRMVLGEIPGYGVVKSTTDLYIGEPHFQVIDWKTTTKKKLPNIKQALTTEPTEYDGSEMAEVRYKVTGYKYQLLTYGRGMVLAGKRVDTVSLGFICRDGVGDADIWGWSMPYDAEAAERVWNRLERLWAWLEAGNDPNELTSATGCYHCSHYR